MKIGIDISQIVYEGTGVARFTNGLVNAVLQYDRQNDWTFFFSSLRRDLNRQMEHRIKSKGYALIKWKIPPTLLSFLWNDLHSNFKFQISNFKLLDWFITSDWTEPSLPIKKAAIVHDLVYLRYPDTVDKKILRTQQKRLSWVKKESQIIFADSISTKQDLIDILKIEPKKIFVNYPGLEIKKPTVQHINQTLKKYSLTKPFILTAGKLEPRKNVERLIDAFSRLKDSNLELVVAGTKGWISNQQYSNITIKHSRIRLLGYVDDESLYSLYSSCLFFIYPSIWEGFGYPVIEAMRLGAPVGTSKTSSLKEIADDVTLLFNPLDSDDIYRCIDTLIHDERLRKELSRKGLERSKIFTWENYYQKMIKALASY